MTDFKLSFNIIPNSSKLEHLNEIFSTFSLKFELDIKCLRRTF